MQMTPQRNRPRTGQTHRWPRRGEARGGDCAAQPLASISRWRSRCARKSRRKNILMIGPTGVGKTEIARRLARLGRCALHQDRSDQIHRSRLRRTRRGYDYSRSGRDGGETSARAGDAAGAIPCDRDGRRARARCAAAVGARGRFRVRRGGRAAFDNATRQKFRKMLREGELDDKEIEIEVSAARRIWKSSPHPAWKS